jgi:hypothetical protein
MQASPFLMKGHLPSEHVPVEHFGALASDEHVPPEATEGPEGPEGTGEDGFFIVTLSSIAIVIANTSVPKAASSNFIITVR